jgi:hypothetical protein
MDNAAIRVVGGWNLGGNDDLLPVLQIALNHHRACAGWSEKDGDLVLYWDRVGDGGVTPLPTPITVATELHSVVVRWLAANTAKAELDGLGDTVEEQGAFEASTDQWGHAGGSHYGMLAIKPRTRWLGK